MKQRNGEGSGAAPRTANSVVLVGDVVLVPLHPSLIIVAFPHCNSGGTSAATPQSTTGAAADAKCFVASKGPIHPSKARHTPSHLDMCLQQQWHWMSEKAVGTKTGGHPRHQCKKRGRG